MDRKNHDTHTIPPTSAPPAGAAATTVAALLALAFLASLAAYATDQRRADPIDPLVSLAAHTPSRTWNLAFWTSHQMAQTPLWRTALAYCLDREEAAFPACTTVRLATWWPAAADRKPEP